MKFGVKNPIYDTIKAILDRAAPLLIDKSSAKELVTLVTKCVNHELLDDDLSSEEDSETFDRDEVSTSGRKALDLLLVSFCVYSYSICCQDVSQKNKIKFVLGKLGK